MASDILFYNEVERKPPPKSAPIDTTKFKSPIKHNGPEVLSHKDFKVKLAAENEKAVEPESIEGAVNELIKEEPKLSFDLEDESREDETPVEVPKKAAKQSALKTIEKTKKKA